MTGLDDVQARAGAYDGLDELLDAALAPHRKVPGRFPATGKLAAGAAVQRRQARGTGPMPSGARELDLPASGAPLQLALDRDAERAPATIDAPKEVEESRATLPVEPAAGGPLSAHQLAHARRSNPAWHRRLGYDAAVFGGGPVGSDEFALAVAAFQQQHGLAVDGVAGPRTFRAAHRGGGRHGAGTPPAAPALDRDAVRDPVTLDARPEWEENRATLSLDEPAPEEQGPSSAAAATAPATASLDRSAERDPATLDARPEWDESRATLPIQLRAAGPRAATDEETHAIAAEGVAGASSRLPHAETIIQRLGEEHRPAIEGIRTQVGGPAATAAAAIGAQAYATGDTIAFAAQPDLHTAAHEATHVLQQRAGVSLKGGIGQAGDPYEQHADAVADAVVGGRPASGLLAATSTGGTPGSSAIQRKDDFQAERRRMLFDAARVRAGFRARHGDECAGKGVDAGCFLGDLRQELDRLIGINVRAASRLWDDAIVDEEIALIARHPAGWSAFWEIAATVALAYATNGASIGIAALGKLGEGTIKEVVGPLVQYKDKVVEVLKVVGGGIKVPLKAAVNGSEAATGIAAADFLSTMHQAAVEWEVDLLREYPTRLNDAERLLLLGLTDPEEILTLEHFRHEVKMLVARWREQVDEVGSHREWTPEGEVESYAWIMPRNGGVPRLARVACATPDGRRGLVPVAFRGWVDEELVSAALAKWQTAVPRQAEHDVTLDRLRDVPDEAHAWEEAAGRDVLQDEEGTAEPSRAYSHDTPIRRP